MKDHVEFNFSFASELLKHKSRLVTLGYKPLL